MYLSGRNDGRPVNVFQASDINKVVFKGYTDDDERIMVDNIQKAMESLDVERADVRRLKQSMRN